ncbi:AraC family transcriptional regulator [Halioglobus pacificus]|uniref:AraC family transcriptional regulator n=2 Tax=Parahalioglobus pacificus TaxID=930806 RepID=A0A918XH83_9GAMM|nr:AraC family transcriptional regulator [Halioglobus pacificus]
MIISQRVNMPLPHRDHSLYSPFVNAVIQAGDHLKAPMEALLKQSNIDRQLLQNLEHPTPVDAVLALYRGIDESCAQPDIGITVGRICYIDGLHLQLYMSTLCETFRDYLNLMPSMLRTTGDIGEVKMQADRAFLKLGWHPLSAATRPQRYLSDTVLTNSAAIVDSLCIHPVPVRRADFTYSRPEDLGLLHQVFGSDLHFEQPVSQLYFERESLYYPLTHLSGDVAAWQFQPLTHLFDENEPPDTFLLELRRTLLRLLPQGDITIDRVADALTLSRRTLQRRLAERDSQFLQILQSVRAEVATRYLADERLSITDIAFLLGYSDQSAFSTAFKSWHGRSPKAYRQR